MAEAIQAQSMKKVASEITDSLHKASEAAIGDGSNASDQPFLEAKGTESDKVKDLHRDMIDVYPKTQMRRACHLMASSAFRQSKPARKRNAPSQPHEPQPLTRSAFATTGLARNWAMMAVRCFKS